MKKRRNNDGKMLPLLTCFSGRANVFFFCWLISKTMDLKFIMGFIKAQTKTIATFVSFGPDRRKRPIKK